MADTGLVNLSLHLEDVQEFIDSFKKMGETVSAVTDQVSQGMLDISKYLKECTDGFNGLSSSLTGISQNLGSFDFSGIKQQIDDFSVFAESLNKAIVGTGNLSQQTQQFAQTFGSADLAKQTKEIQQTIADLKIPELFLNQTADMKKAFEQIAQSLTSVLEPKLNEMINLLKQISVNTATTANETSQLNQQFKDLSDSLNKASESWAKDITQMKKTDSWLTRISNGFKKLFRIRSEQNNQTDTGEQTTQTGQGTMGMFNNKTIKEGLNYIAWTAKRVFYFSVINGVIGAFKDIPSVGRQYEKTLSNLSVSFGGNIKLAKAQFQELNNTINNIPQSFEEVVNATKTLRLFNFATSEKDLIALSKVAEGTGESFEGLADAMGKFTEGNYNSLKKFGITAKDEGDKIALSFKGSITEIAKDTQSLQNYINNLADTEFATALDEQMNGLSGSYKRLQNAWGDLSLELYNSGIKEFLIDMTNKGISYIQNFISWLKNPEIKSNIKAFLRLAQNVADSVGEFFKLSWTAIIKGWEKLNAVVNSVARTIGGAFNWVLEQFGVAVDGFKTEIDSNISYFQFWCDTLITIFKTVAQGFSNLRSYIVGDAMQIEINAKANLATKDILKDVNFKDLKDAIEKEYGEDFEGKTFFAGDKTVIEDYAQTVQDKIVNLQELRKKLDSTLSTVSHKRVREDIIKGMENTEKELQRYKKLQIDVAHVMQDSRYKAQRGEYESVIPSLNDNFQKTINERIKTLEEERRKAQEKLNKVFEGTNTKFNDKTNGKGGGGGHDKELKDWNEFYEKMLAKVTDYGKERVNLIQQYHENIKELDKHYAEDANVSFEQYNNLKLELQKKFDKDMQDLIRNQNEAVSRLFNSDYKNKLLDLEKALREREKTILNSYANGALTESEKNNALLLNAKKFNEDSRKLQKEAEIEQNQLLQNEHMNEIASLQQQYDKKLELLKQYLDDERITHEEYEQGRIRQKAYYDEQLRKLEESEFSASSGVVSNAMSSFEKLDQTLRKYDLTFSEVLGTLTDKGKLTQKQNAMMWSDMSLGMSNYFGALSQNFEKGSGVYNTMFALQKGFAIASATISMIQGAMEAWKLGFPAGLMAGMGVLAQGASLIGQLKSVQFRAKGGRLDPNALTVVGEQGAELITGVSGNVISNSKSKDLLNNLGNNNNNVTVNLVEDASRAGQVQQRTDNDQQTIIDVIVANIRNGGEVANAMSGTYGLARQGY